MIGFVEFQGEGLIVDGGEDIEGYSGGAYHGNISRNMNLFPREFSCGTFFYSVDDELSMDKRLD